MSGMRQRIVGGLVWTAAFLLLCASFQAARAAGAGTELIGFPSDPEDEAGTPACLPGAPPDTRFAQAGSEVAPPYPAPAPAPAVQPTPAVRPVPKAPRAPRVRNVEASRGDRSGATSTDTTIAVRAGTKLSLHNFGGSVNLAAWGKNAVRVRAEHSRRDWVAIGLDGSDLEIQSRSRTGPSHAVDYEITVPSWMPVALSGVYNDVTVDGVKGGINVETVSGDITVRRVAGDIELRSVEGLVDLLEARGNIVVSSVNDGVRVVNVSGDVLAEAVNGDIRLLDLDSKTVEANTVNGTVLYDGKILDDGVYTFSTHNGDIALGLSDRANATVTVATFAGEFEYVYPVLLTRTKKG